MLKDLDDALRSLLVGVAKLALDRVAFRLQRISLLFLCSDFLLLAYLS
jgi:hypothetical protein